MQTKIEAIIKKASKLNISWDVAPAPKENFGHYSTSIALRLAKEDKKNPILLAEEMANKIRLNAPRGVFDRIEVTPPGFINFWLTTEFHQKEIQVIAKTGAKFGHQNVGKKKSVIVEFSSANIAKAFHVGHLRGTIMGDVLSRIYSALGYKVIRWNYLGDWGTQFGKVIAAYKLWGKKKSVREKPIETLVELYVRFHEEMGQDPSLEPMGREEFRKLEDGDKENRKLWEWFKNESIKELKKTYKTLGVAFDIWIGESYFEDKLKALISDLLRKNIAIHSEGAVIIPLEDKNLPPALLAKSDGASLYLTRDIENIKYRVKKYNPAKILYIVGNEQALHFEQLFAVSEKLGLTKGNELIHVKHGLILGEDGRKFATREGKVVPLAELIEKSVALAKEVVEKKSRGLTPKEKTTVANAVALGGLRYLVLRENRNSDIIFDWNKMLDFSGESGPYIQYTNARLLSIIRKAKRIGRANISKLTSDLELRLIRKISEMPEAVRIAGETISPNTLTSYLYELATLTNKYYEDTPILTDPEVYRKNARLSLIRTASQTLSKGLGLLGIQAPPKI